MDTIEENIIRNNRAFEEMLKIAKERLKNRIPEDIAQRSGATFRGEDFVLGLLSLNQMVLVSIPEYTFCPQLEEWHQLVALHYLDLADGMDVSDQIITFGELKNGLVRGSKFDRYIENELQRFLKGKTLKSICKICKSLGAEFLDSNADVCAVFPFLPNYPVWMKVWLADEEFEASGKFYISESANHYLSMEDAVTVGEILLSKLKIQEKEYFKDDNNKQ